MKNKEKRAMKIVEIACDGKSVAVDKRTGKVVSCDYITCGNCLFDGKHGCNSRRREWAESDYIEKPVISKRDRTFLEYLGNELKYIARESYGDLMAYECSVSKGESRWLCESGAIKSFLRLNVQLPMVKWSDKEPWLIEDLKRLDVVEEYN